MKADVLIRNHVNISGKGEQVLVFAHGFGCDQQLWRFVAPAFEDEYRVVLFDYVGSGKSDYHAYDPEKYRDLYGYADDVLDILNVLELENTVFIGHSASGMIGLLAAIQQPGRFERQIMIGPSPCYLNDPPEYAGGFEREDISGLFDMMEMNYIGWANYLSRVIMQNPSRPQLSKELAESFCSTDPYIARQFAEAVFLSDYRPKLAEMPVPSLLMQCRDDAIAPHCVGEYMHRHMPESRLWMMEATGHCPHVSHPEETIRIIKRYLESSL